jgi:hypothetical protein
MRRRTPANSEEGEVGRSVVGIMEQLLMSLGFTGRASVVMQNERVIKSGYEEGYFHPGHGGALDLERRRDFRRGGVNGQS